MTIVTFRLCGKPETSLEIYQSLKGIAAKVHKADGCCYVHVYRNTDDENTFFVVEKWKHQRKLDDHMKTSLFQALRGLRNLLKNDIEVTFLNE